MITLPIPINGTDSRAGKRRDLYNKRRSSCCLSPFLCLLSFAALVQVGNLRFLEHTKKRRMASTVAAVQQLPSRRELVRLFRDLWRASRAFKFTDRSFFLSRVRAEFRKTVREEGEAIFWFKVKFRLYLFLVTSLNLYAIERATCVTEQGLYLVNRSKIHKYK